MPVVMGPGQDKPLIDLSTGREFDPWCAGDWPSAIASSAVGIGSFLTPFVHGRRVIHIRHLVNRPSDLSNGGISADFVRYPVLPQVDFACVKSSAIDAQSSSYCADIDAKALLDPMPSGRIIVHIDFDYFLNDFNGNPGQAPQPIGTAASPKMINRMNRLFDALSGYKVAGWISATSPGFCAARHWASLHEAFSERIAGHRAEEAKWTQ